MELADEFKINYDVLICRFCISDKTLQKTFEKKKKNDSSTTTKKVQRINKFLIEKKKEEEIYYKKNGKNIPMCLHFRTFVGFLTSLFIYTLIWLFYY
jgi:hypothetical protein